MSYVKRLIFTWAFISAAACSLKAQSCNAELFPLKVEMITAATVSVDRAPVLSEDEGCPERGAACAGKAYLLKGDRVFVGEAKGAYRCIAFYNGKRQTTGFLPAASLTAVPTPAVEGDWSGEWERIVGDGLLTIRKKNGVYSAEMEATYAPQPGNVRTGVADGKITAQKISADVTVLSFGGPGADRTVECRVHLRPFGAWMLADDGATADSNSACGGMGVSLNGIYKRSKSMPAGKK